MRRVTVVWTANSHCHITAWIYGRSSDKITYMIHSYAAINLRKLQQTGNGLIISQTRSFMFIRLGDRLPPNIGFSLRGNLAVFTRLAIISPKMNRFGWNLEHSVYIAGGWPWQILGAIRAVATVWEAGEFFCQVNNARFHRFPVG